MAKKTVNLIGYNVLLEEAELENKSSGGIIIPDTHKEEQDLICGKVIRTGPGFLIPQTAEHDVSTVLGESSSLQVKAQFIPLDVKEGDMVYYNKGAGEEIMLNGKIYVILPYPMIKLFIRSEGGEFDLDNLKSVDDMLNVDGVDL